MARVSNFTCNNETRGATHRIKGPGDEGGKAETYRRIDAVGVDGRNERAMIGRKIGRGTRSVNDREKDGGKMIYMWSVPFLRFPRPPFPTTRPQNTALTTDITSEKPCRSIVIAVVPSDLPPFRFPFQSSKRFVYSYL